MYVFFFFFFFFVIDHKIVSITYVLCECILRVAKKLLQMFPKYDKKLFANVVTGDET